MFASMVAKQVEFSRTMAYFQVWCFENGYDFVEAESFRPIWVAEEYKRRGKGILNSNHTRKLARDLFRVKGGTITWDVADYTVMGEKWKSMHPLSRWGGDFLKLRDAVHFSFEHNGVI